MSERVLNVSTPENCQNCGINTKDNLVENPKVLWLKVDLLPVISLF